MKNEEPKDASFEGGPETILPLTRGAQSALSVTLSSRANKYGDFADVARISEKLLNAARSEPEFWAKLDDTKKEGVKLILHKIARAMSGDPEYTDNWHDIAGYAKLVEDRCNQGAK